MNTIVYQHPDGHEINLTRGVLTVTNVDCADSVSVPIGHLGLRELGERLITLSERQTTKEDDAESAGNTIASNCLDAMLQVDNHKW